MMRMTTLLALLTVLACAAGSAQAATVYETELMPEFVVPESGADAWGRATLIVSDDHSEMYLTVNFAGLESPQTSAGLSIGGADEIGTMILELPLGVPLAETIATTPDLLDALANDLLSIQIGSEDWPEGAIRGNFEFVMVGAEVSSWTEVKTLFD